MDAVGSNIVVNTRCGEVMRILPRMNEVGQPSLHCCGTELHVGIQPGKCLWNNLSELKFK